MKKSNKTKEGRESKLDYVLYTWRHKIAFLKMEKKLTGRVSLRGVLHDSEKLILYWILPTEVVKKIHNKLSRHHDRAHTLEDYIQIIIDMECARFTKPDKPYTCREYLSNNDPKLFEKLSPLLDYFKI